jgi:hypothetical protein
LWLSEERTRGFREALLRARVSFTRMQAGDGFSSSPYTFDTHKRKSPVAFQQRGKPLSEERTRGFREALLHARVSFTRMQAGDGFSS